MHLHNNQQRELLLIVGGGISTFMSGLVVLSGLIFNSLMLNKTHPFSNIIFFISICDMGGSVAHVLGFPRNGTMTCTAQSFLILFFFPASWLWTTSLVYQLRCMVVYRKLHVSMFTLHCICWGIALLVALLPLSDNTYGEDDDLSTHSVCQLRSNDKQKKFEWLVGLFDGVLLICVALMAYWMVNIIVVVRKKGDQADYREMAIFNSTKWYPVGMLWSWALSIAVNFTLATTNHVNIKYIQIGQILQTQYGTILAVIFFANSKIIRYKWKELLCPSRNAKDRTLTTGSPSIVLSGSGHSVDGGMPSIGSGSQYGGGSSADGSVVMRDSDASTDVEEGSAEKEQQEVSEDEMSHSSGQSGNGSENRRGEGERGGDSEGSGRDRLPSGWLRAMNGFFARTSNASGGSGAQQRGGSRAADGSRPNSSSSRARANTGSPRSVGRGGSTRAQSSGGNRGLRARTRSDLQDALDPEGAHFAQHDSMVEGPRLSELLKYAPFGQFHGRSGDSGHSENNNTNGGSHNSTDPNNQRLSTLIRGWIVQGTRPDKGRESEITRGDVLNPAIISGGEGSGSGQSSRMTSDERGAGSSSTGSGSGRSSFTRFAPPSSGPGGRESPVQNVTGNSTGGTGANSTISPLAAAIERARSERGAGGAAAGTGGGTNQSLAVSLGAKGVLASIEEERGSINEEL